jgi:HSP20 family molecular chaperone IbpA
MGHDPLDDEDKVEAAFRNRVLTVTLPWSETAQSQVRRIAITEPES